MFVQLGCLTALLAAQIALADTQFYQFSINEDAIQGAADFSALNHPLTPADKIFVRDGHFYRVGSDLQPNTADDERVRFFGTNFAFTAAFPAPEDAPRIAKRIRRLGMNLVRLHWMDYWFGAPLDQAEGMLTGAPYPDLNQLTVARLKNLIGAFAAEGVYVDLNIHVGYTFRPAVDGVPSLSVFPDMSKPLHIFYPKMIDKQKEYATSLINGLELKDNPSLAVVEIDNEASLVHYWESDWDNEEQFLVGEYRVELQRQWNTYLKAQYASTGALKQSWGASTPDGPNLLRPTWQLELHSPAQATMTQSQGVVTVRVTTGGNWVIVKNVGFSLDTSHRYVAEVEMRADLPAGQSRNVNWNIMRDVSPWDATAYTNVAVTNAWQKFRLLVNPTSAYDGVGRFHLSVENVEFPIYIRNASIALAGTRALDPQESLEAANISILPRSEAASPQRLRDYLLFLADRDRFYLNEIAGAVRLAAGPTVSITGTQVGFGGTLNYDSHRDMSYIDNHYYVDHYGFPNTAWDGNDWTINDTAAVGEGLWQLWGMAATRQAGKPFTISEYNQPWPNTHSSEQIPSVAAFGAFQDWDGLLEYNYRQDRVWDQGVMNAFNLSGNWTQYPVSGQSAWLFRTALHAGSKFVDVPLPLDQRIASAGKRYEGDLARFLTDTAGYNADIAFLHPVRLATDSPASIPVFNVPAPPYRSETNEITFDKNARRLLIHSGSAAGAIGFLDGKVTAGSMDVELGPSARGFATILATALDGKMLSESGTILLTTPGYTLRSQPGINPPRPQNLVHYRGSATSWTLEPDTPGKPSGSMWGGSAPTWMERVESFVTLHTIASAITVYPLDGNGGRMDGLSNNDVQKTPGGFRIHLQSDSGAKTPWYEIVTTGAKDAATFAVVNAASLRSGPQAPSSLVTGFGTGLGSSVTIRDITGGERSAQQFYASPSQINFAIPDDVPAGPATITIAASDGSSATAMVQVDPVAPGLFAAGATGLAAATITRITPDGTQSSEPVVQLDSGGSLVAKPIDLGPPGTRVYLILYGTGIRHASATTAVLNGKPLVPAYSGPQGYFTGLDQINVLLPRTLIGAGTVAITFQADAKTSNTVKIEVR